MRAKAIARLAKRNTNAFKRSVKRNNYLQFIKSNKIEVFDKSKVVYRDGDNT